MATVLVSFIGKGNFDKNGKRNYRKANYKFAAEDGHSEALFKNSSLFGVSLLKRLQSCGRNVDRWLVMGTQLSTWDALIESIAEDEHDRIEGVYFEVGEAIENARTDQLLLDRWQDSLNELAPTQIVCRLVGAADGFESQEKIWQALNEVVKDGDKIVLDVTNGLRHQPVIASFMVMLLRWLRRVKRVDLYYGAFELMAKEKENDKEIDVCPVLRLPLCNDLLEATEAVSTLQETGGFSALGKWFKLDAAKLQEVVFADEVNHANKEVVAELRDELEVKTSGSIRKTLSPLLDEALNWAGEPSLPRIYRRKALFAFEHEQYFQAIALLWEAIVEAGCHRYNIGAGNTDPASRRFVDDAHQKLRERLPRYEQKRTLDKVQFLRNAVMHGTRPDTRRGEGRAVDAALRNKEAFKRLFDEGRNLLDELLGLASSAARGAI